MPFGKITVPERTGRAIRESVGTRPGHFRAGCPVRGGRRRRGSLAVAAPVARVVLQHGMGDMAVRYELDRAVVVA